jgi:gluconate 2-dehydrogenase gamma chain
MTAPQAGSGAAGSFFNAHQRATIEAAMARIIPTDDQPGAREAGTIEFLDRYLSGLEFIYAKPDGSGFEKLEGKRAEAWQQRIEILRAKYIEGVRELDSRSQAQFGVEFVLLTSGQQDHILTGMERPSLQIEALVEPAPAGARSELVEPALQQTSAEIELDFFPLLALDTRQGFYADPIYGGKQKPGRLEVNRIRGARVASRNARRTLHHLTILRKRTDRLEGGKWPWRRNVNRSEQMWSSSAQAPRV